jgi:STAS-like domain of unknown function (DUF4325)
VVSQETVIIKFPENLRFRHYEILDFDQVLSIFNWDLHDQKVCVDLSDTTKLNYQAFALLVSYIWHLRTKGCFIDIRHSQNSEAAWKKMGATGWSQVLYQVNQNFLGAPDKPLIAIRNSHDFKIAVEKTETYTKSFDIEYEKTLRYVLSELIYNAMEHGRTVYTKEDGLEMQIPSIIQFNWYQSKNELSFIIADLGIGVKQHLSQAYPGLESDTQALRRAIEPKVSGTFGQVNPYSAKNNAGVGLFISSNIMRRLGADLYIVSGNGAMHVSPKDITTKELQYPWPGTFIYSEVRLGAESQFELHSMMQELRGKANQEIDAKSKAEQEGNFYVHIRNFFGVYAEDKESAKRFRDTQIMQRVEAGEQITLDFVDVKAAPHSFLNALLATPISRLGIKAYKKIRVINASPEIRETLDFILDENTES